MAATRRCQETQNSSAIEHTDLLDDWVHLGGDVLGGVVCDMHLHEGPRYPQVFVNALVDASVF
jgi:hypothetical protein